MAKLGTGDSNLADETSTQPLLVARSEDIVGYDNFPQGCSFSPDGLCVLTSTSSDHVLRLYNTPSIRGNNNATEETAHSTSSEQNISPWRSALCVRGGDCVRSYAWYPKMNSMNPETCCFAATSRDQPIHLVDAYTSTIRASYRPYNALDEMESPSVVNFTPDGQRIFSSGFSSDRTIHVFDTNTPGRDSMTLRLGKTRRSKDGQKGLVSALAFSPSYSGNNPVFAIGTYAPGSIYIYDARMPSSCHPAATILNGVCVVGHGSSHCRKKRRFASLTENDCGDEGFSFSAAKVRWFQTRARGGVTQVSFSPSDEYYLYSSSRRGDSVLSWDVRMVSGSEEHRSFPIRGWKAFATDSNTNQRLEFDFDESGSRLFVGGRDGRLRIFSIKSGEMTGAIDGMKDSVNGVSYSYNSQLGCGLLAVAVGSRRFSLDDIDFESVANENIVPGFIEVYKVPR